jgi:hypothetical protein
MNKAVFSEIKYQGMCQLLKAKINHVFNRNVDFIFERIFEEATSLPFDNFIYVEKEMNFEIDRQLGISQITDEFLQDSVLKDYRFLEPMARNPLEFRALLYVDSRNFTIVKSIIAFRKKRVKLIESNKSDSLTSFRERFRDIMGDPYRKLPIVCLSKEDSETFRQLFLKQAESGIY